MDDRDGLSRLLDSLIELARGKQVQYDSVDAWWPAFRAARRDWSQPIDQALIGGVTADRAGYAFAAGYQAALRFLDAGLPEDRICCLSVTEEGGGHPRAVKATFTPIAGSQAYSLSGRKKWATLSSAGGVALVVASTGTDAEGRNQLRVARVDLGSPGVKVVPMPPTPFIPEIQHCRLEFDDVRVEGDRFLAGDGYTRYVRPFRTVEDTHVGAGILGYLLNVAFRHEWPRDIREGLLHLIVGLRALAMADPSAPTTHVALEGLFHTRDELMKRTEALWQQVDADERERWLRDAGIASIAGNVRARRAESAWEKLGAVTR